MSPTPVVPSSLNQLSANRAFWFAAAVTFLVFLSAIFTPSFIVDSWSYLELSNSIFRDFFHLNTLRRFETQSLYSQAFPPLWPVLIAVTRKVADLGIYTGLLLNFPICLCLLAALIRLFQRLEFPGWIGAACYLSILGFPPFRWDALGAKTFPLYLTLLTCALVILVQERAGTRRVALAGLTMGLACLNRFDALAASCIIGAAFGLSAYLPERRLARAVAVLAVYFAVLGATISPMVAYGMLHFGKPFPSDNTSMVQLAHGGTSFDYYAAPPQSDLLHTPRKWLAGLVLYKLPRIAYSFFQSAMDSIFPFLAAVVLVTWGASRPLPLPPRTARFAVFGLVLIPLMLIPTVLAGFLDSRYFSAPVMILFALLFLVLVSLTAAAWNARRAILFLLVLAVPLSPALVHPLVATGGHLHSLTGLIAPVSPTPQMQRVTDAVRRDSAGQPHRIVFTDGHITAVKYGALTGEPTAMMPRLMSGTFADFARDWNITHVYDAEVPRLAWEPERTSHTLVMGVINSPGLELVPLDLPGLYRVRLTSKQTRP